MNCEILEILYVKSNGEILCNCDVGEQVLLGRIDPNGLSWDITNVLTNSKYSHIRKSLSSDLVPWERICKNCAFFQKDGPFLDNLNRKYIRKIHIEPSLACNLDCPCCSSRSQRQVRSKPHLMDLEVFETLLCSLTHNAYFVESIEYCGQGEPLLHPQFSGFIKTAKKYYPSIKQMLITNGNFDYWKAIQGTFIDTIYVSCDGVFQDSYEKYRIRGDVQKAINFMKDVPKILQGMKQRLVWKYILFEFNDSDEEIITAQHLANTIGVDTLLFVLTHSKFKSMKYRPETITKLPIIYPNVTTSHTPQRNKEEEGLNSIESNVKDSMLNFVIRKLPKWMIRPLKLL